VLNLWESGRFVTFGSDSNKVLLYVGIIPRRLNSGKFSYRSVECLSSPILLYTDMKITVPSIGIILVLSHQGRNVIEGARSEVLTAVFTLRVFWGVTPCRLVSR
jgi:hypothetical protein